MTAMKRKLISAAVGVGLSVAFATATWLQKFLPEAFLSFLSYLQWPGLFVSLFFVDVHGAGGKLFPFVMAAVNALIYWFLVWGLLERGRKQ